MSAKWKWISILSSVALTLAVAGAWLFGTTMTASAAEMTAEEVQTLTQSTTQPGLFGEGYLAHGGWGQRGFGGGSIDYQQLLADALGISTEALAAAREQANQAALEQAIAEGILTQAQADEMAERKQVHEALASYLDQKALMAAALGLSVDELEAALAEGKTMRDLFDSASAGGDGLDAATVRENVQAAHEAALAQAVADGVITQEQADELSAGRSGMRRFGGRGIKFDPENMPERENWPDKQGLEGFRNRGGPGGRRPWSPDSGGTDGMNDDSTSGTRFRHLGRAIQDSSAL